MTAARDAGLPVLAGTTIAGTSGRLRRVSVRLSGRWAALACDTLLMCGGWTPSVHLFSQSRGKLRFDEAIGAFVPGEQRTRAVRRCLRWNFRSRRLSGRRLRRRGSSERAAMRCAARSVASANRPCGTAHPARPARQGVRRFPERRDDEGFADRDARGISLDRTCETLHHRRDGDGPGQDVQRQCAGDSRRRCCGNRSREVGHTTFRMPYTPVTFGALAGRGAGRSVRPGAADAAARMGSGARRGVRGCRHLEARALLSSRRRRRCSGGGARVPRGAQRGRPARRQHTGQDRGGRPGRGGVPRSDLHRRLQRPGARALPLRAAAGRGRFRAGRRHRRRGSRRIGSMSPRRPAARRACCIIWRTTGRPNFPICACG